MPGENKRARIGIGIITYNRPKYFKKCIKSVLKHLSWVDEIVIVDDGSKEDYVSQYADKAYVVRQANGGVAKAKNTAMRHLMERDCAFIFICEDDMVIQSRNAIVHYLAAYKMTGIDHMLFAHHGPANDPPERLLGFKGPVEFYVSCIGAFCFYTKDILEKVGLMDENFVNAWEHVEHSWRIMKHHKMPYGYWPDVVESRKLIKEVKGSIDNSSIGAQDNPDRIKVIIKGLEYWKKKDKKFPAQHTLDYYTNLLQEMEND